MKHMKRLLSLMLTLLLVLGMSTAAFAKGDSESGDSGTTGAGTSQSQDMSKITLTKNINYLNENTTYPGETLKFTSVLTEITDSANNTVENRTGLDLTIDDVTVKSGEKTATITIELPTYDSVGIYIYKINETAGNVAGVTYYANDIELKVFVTNGDNGALIRSAVVTSRNADKQKITGITNTYSAGSLSVTKNVTGNMGDKNKEFEVKVTFNAPSGQTVKSTISYVEDGKTKTISENGGWTNSQTVTIKLKNGETVKFTNIPYGVTYSVTEENYTTTENGGYDAAKYSIGSGDPSTNAPSNITVGKDHASDTVTITNKKEKNVDTGIDLDSLPYILVLAVACVGLVAFVSKKRMMREN